MDRIPEKVLEVIQDFLVKDYEEHGGKSAPVIIVLQSAPSEYVIYCPPQKVTAYSSEYETEPEVIRGKKAIAVLHSHGSLGAFLSDLDGQSIEVDTTYGIIGRLNLEELDVKFWTKYEAEIKPLNYDEVVAKVDAKIICIPESLCKNVTIRSPMRPKL